MSDTTSREALQLLESNARRREGLEAERYPLMRVARAAGATWAAIGKAQGMSKQAAQDYFTRREESPQ